MRHKKGGMRDVDEEQRHASVGDRVPVAETRGTEKSVHLMGSVRLEVSALCC